MTDQSEFVCFAVPDAALRVQVPAAPTGKTAGERYDQFSAWLDMNDGDPHGGALDAFCSRMTVIRILESCGVMPNDSVTDAQWNWVIRAAKETG